MATEAQKEANRRNAQKSTGPRTIVGKARVSRNATKHGLCHTIAVMSDENREEFEQILEDLNEEHQPQGTTEAILVYKMAVSFLSSWRAQILLTERLDINDTQDDSKQVALMLRYYNTSDRSFNKNLHDLRNLQKERRQEEIGFVPQIIPPIVPTPPDPTSLDPEIQPDDGFPSREMIIEPPKRAA
jgi:hypothetical protein